ncbi:WXG100 family type VII secretion target [Pseudarthrobacter sp. J75]|uniref:WXG100 family type VII secretion target n=1 Tax=unclassified Pseudarthrobacter TaxID=2647000 RepID=UPI002E804C84|nr:MULTISPECIES: WXG100 family type VII secretion target [unclassified Pseudarthrobacter]MEE2523706.1 WXG100 family type VII secretion target [Pseudarthrobacter sp. J47]MEE2530097.1 WXG100 family type VII secretion target [Pseudarthrobacter sp. J75]
MAGNFYGADVAQLRQLAKDMANGATRLGNLGQQLSSAVSTSPWKGNDAERFRSAWSSHHLKVLKSASAQLNAASKALLRNADEQDKSSNSNGGSGSGNANGPGGGPHSTDPAAQELTDKLEAMTPAERAEYLASDEFKKWALEHPEAAKAAMDAAADSGLINKKSEEYADFLSDYWNQQAMREMGIDPSTWDTSLGTEHNWETIKSVYDFYGKAYLANPDLQWAGMANMIGPSFAGGFRDMALLRDLAQQITNNPVSNVPLPVLDQLEQLANMTDEEIKFYETSMLDMNKEIFLDQAWQHQAYMNGGIEEINRLQQSGAIDSVTARAWEQIDSGDPALIKEGNTTLLYREQNSIIADDYTNMRNHPGGEAVTYLVTLAGEPSIPEAKSFPEVFPYTYSVESPGPEKLPWTNWDNPAQFRTDFTTGFPDGNIADADQRWALISQDTLPAYQKLLANDPDRAAQIIGQDFNQRVDEHRPLNNIGNITGRFLDGFDVEVHQ